MLTLTQDPARAACQRHATTCVNLLSLAPDVRRFSYTLCNTHAHGYPQVLECVFSHLHHIEDIASLAASCKRLSAAATTAPLTLQLASPRCSSFDSKTLGVVLTSTCRRFPAIRALDLSGTCVEDADVLAACRLLRSLHTLQLANCRKITDALFLGSARPPLSTVTPAVQVMCLQRCFQMTHEALVAIMHTKQGPPLTCLVMSHLELHAWPTRTLPAPPTTLSNLRMLALLNSTLDAAALRALGGCTALCYLFLGGSLTCYTPPQQDPPPARHANLLRVLDANATLRTALHAAVHVEGMRRNDQQQPALALALELTVLLQQLTHVQLLEATFALRGCCQRCAYCWRHRPACNAWSCSTSPAMRVSTPCSACTLLRRCVFATTCAVVRMVCTVLHLTNTIINNHHRRASRGLACAPPCRQPPAAPPPRVTPPSTWPATTATPSWWQRCSAVGPGGTCATGAATRRCSWRASSGTRRWWTRCSRRGQRRRW